MCAAYQASSPRPHRPVRVGAPTAAVGIHAGLWLIAAPVAVALVVLEAALATTVILTALFASPHFSERAFRLLPYTTPTLRAAVDGRSEANGPTTGKLVLPDDGRGAQGRHVSQALGEPCETARDSDQPLPLVVKPGPA